MKLFFRGGARRWAALVLLCAAGCTSLRAIPPSDYDAQPERKNVHLQTRDGLVYEFDFVRVAEDTLTGFRSRSNEGLFEDYASVRVPLMDITVLETRTVDWYRTGLMGAGLAAAVVVVGSRAANKNGDEPSSGGGKPPIP